MSSAGRTKGVRKKLDFYQTPSWLTESILPYLKPHLPECTYMLEPGYGDGAIARVVEQSWPNCDVTGIDLEKRTDNNKVIIADYLTYNFGDTRYNLILGNPPYNLAQEFVNRSLQIADVVCLLMRVNFLGSQKRAEWWRDKLPSIYVTPRRPPFSTNKNGKIGTDSTEYAWYVWGLPDQGTVHILETEDKKHRSK
jgi:hypothetical protein